jgi:hypothetical protein
MCFELTLIPFKLLDETHCSDIPSINMFDSPEMIASKNRITQLVRQWLGRSE